MSNVSPSFRHLLCFLLQPIAMILTVLLELFSRALPLAHAPDPVEATGSCVCFCGHMSARFRVIVRGRVPVRMKARETTEPEEVRQMRGT